ncbi:hypothetical protein FPY71_04900 [Aureimonas fodinaquatilis]|uniref:GT-D fold-like domain-containing protein n=1 Tax=Aureimonas fodinaquatilis TaxID=2565783 RepID=A0A5B0E289_9HYPH|nr:hypothetical protein [Aureimonas fodinaquatilis]KAA0972432.1 hypothetical protein FPY71_04900 [Aureimonas fodinaquatilis]
MADTAQWRDYLDFAAGKLDDFSLQERENFRSFVQRPYSIVTANSDLMDIRFCQEKRKRLEEIIQHHLVSGTALSLIRLGDGEAYGFAPPAISGAGRADFDADDRLREAIWWGKHPLPEQAERLRGLFQQAVNEADILAIPSIFRWFRDCGRMASGLAGTRARRGLIAVLNGVAALAQKPDRLFTEERVHQFVFSEDFLEQLAKQARHVVVVTCWRQTQLKPAFLANAQMIAVSPHTKVRDGQSFEEMPPLFENYHTVISQIERVAQPGTLVLIAAGFIGKIFTHAARQQGAVALDIGACVDYMAGRKTRSISDLV